MREILTPYDYQMDDIKRLAPLNHGAAFHEPGCGKTIIAINLWRYKSNRHKRPLKTIVFAPLIVLENWKREFLQCSQVEERSIGVAVGTAKKRLKVIEDPKHKILIVNYEATQTKAIQDALVSFGAEMSIADESHLIKNHKKTTASGKLSRFGAVCRITENCYYRLALTGTPIANDITDLWAQYYYLDRGETFGKNFFSFKNKYMVDLNKNMPRAKYFPNWQPIKSKDPELRAKISSVSVRRTKESCVELPDRIEQVIEIPMTTEQTKIYKDLKDKLVAWINESEDNPMVVKNALTKLLRLNQVLCGFATLEDGEIITLKSNPRIEALMSLLDSIGKQKTIVSCIYKEDYKAIKHALDKKKIKWVEITGEISSKKKFENMDLFNDLKSDTMVCIVNPRAGGVGCDLRAAGYDISYSRSFSAVDREQMQARNFRSGSVKFHKKIVSYDLTTPNSVCSNILDALRNKKEISRNLLDIKSML